MPYYHFLQDVAVIWVVIVFVLALFAAGYAGAPLLVYALLWSALALRVGSPCVALGAAGRIGARVSCACPAAFAGFRPGHARVGLGGFSAHDFRNRTGGHRSGGRMGG